MEEKSYEEKLIEIEELVYDISAIINVCNDAIQYNAYNEPKGDILDYSLVLDIAKSKLDKISNYF